MISLVLLIIGVVVGYIIGYHWRWLKDKFEFLEDNKPAIGATPGSYHRVNENIANQDGEVGIVTPKTPSMLEWEESERLRQENLNVEVKRR